MRAGGEVIAGVTTFSDVTDRARAEQRLRFLAEASTVLGSSLDYEQTLVAVSELAVPMLADWCSISVLEDDDTVKVVSWTHSDPERRRWADEMRTRRQVRLDDATPTAEVIRSGKPVLVREITDEIVARYRPEDAELARAMGVRSFVVVPFTSGAGTLGSIMLVSAESGREFDDDDVLLARELGRRAGAAIENARSIRRWSSGRGRPRRSSSSAKACSSSAATASSASGTRRRRRSPVSPSATSRAGRPPTRFPGGRSSRSASRWWTPATPSEPEPGRPVQGRRRRAVARDVRRAVPRRHRLRLPGHHRGARLERMKSDFVSTVSHELRTPLAAIYGAALTLRRADMPLPDDQRQELLGVIADEADRLARIVNDILWTSRIESGAMQVQIESCDAADLATTVVQAARLHLPAGVALDLTGAADLLRVAADPDKVRQVLANLVDNAVKYSPGGGRVEVALERHDGAVRFAVSDEGLGIPAGERERVFEKFYRLDPGLTRGVGGTGLGLFICRELARRMDGWIWIEGTSPGARGWCSSSRRPEGRSTSYRRAPNRGRRAVHPPGRPRPRRLNHAAKGRGHGGGTTDGSPTGALIRLEGPSSTYVVRRRLP